MAKVCSHVVIVLPSGALMTTMPRSVAAARSSDLRLAAHEQRVVIADDGGELVFAQAGLLVDGHVFRIDQLLNAVVADRIHYENSEHAPMNLPCQNAK